MRAKIRRNNSMDGNSTCQYRNPIVRIKCSSPRNHRNNNYNKINQTQQFNYYYPEKNNNNKNKFNTTISTRQSSPRNKNYNQNYYNDNDKTYNNYNNYNENNKKNNRNSSAKTKPNAEKYFYKLICDNCYNNKLAAKNLKKLDPPEKEKLRKNFLKVNPFIFQDQMNDFQKQKLNDKKNDLENLQAQALDNLAKYKKDHPDPKETLQKKNECCPNPMVDYAESDPRIAKAKKNYDLKENLIAKNKDLYNFDKPRDAINDYYNKCMYQVPVLELIHETNPEYQKEFIDTLKKQIADKEKNDKLRKKQQLESEKLANERFKQYNDYINRKNLEEKKKNQQDLHNKNKLMDEYKKKKADQEKKDLDKYYNDLRKKMKEEDEANKNKQLQEKLNNINNFQNWLKEFDDKKKAEKQKALDDKKKWENYAKEYDYKCKHGNYLTRCALCNKAFPKEKLVKYFYTPSNTTSAASSQRESFVK